VAAEHNAYTKTIINADRK